MAVNQGVHFLNTNGFLRLGDEQAMESGHSFWNMLNRWFKQFKDKHAARQAYMRYSHIRNCCVLVVAAEKKSRLEAAE